MSTKTHPDGPRSSLPPSVVILGNDAQLAARPATPIQLAHACMAAGYRAVVPASWGDELIASATMQALAAREVRPAIHCACPHVAHRVLAVGSDLSPYLVSLVSPPVAAARYVRQYAPAGVRITYVGRCPGASDDAIDARLTPEELLAQLSERGISIAEQPLVFESVIPPDRRRHRSQPGGLPSPETMWESERPTTVEIVSEDDLVSEIAEKILAATNSLLDFAPSLGCVCAGAIQGAIPVRARDDVVALEPPRAPSPVVDERFAAGLELPLPAAMRSPLDIIVPPAVETASPERVAGPPLFEQDGSVIEPTPPRRPRFTPPEAEAPAVQPAPRRRPQGTANRVVPGTMPVASDSDGRVLPRAYVARRRSPRSGIPVVKDPVPAVKEGQRPAASMPVDEPQRATSTPATNGETHAARGEPITEPRTAPRGPRAEHLAKAPIRSPQVTVVEPSVVGRMPRDLAFATPTGAPVAAHTQTPEPKALDTELPIVQSIEPVAATNGHRAAVAAAALPVLVDQLKRTTRRVSGGVRAIAAQSPRTSLIVAIASFMLLGAVIGFMTSRMGTERTRSGEASGQVEDQHQPVASPRRGTDSLRGVGANADSALRRSLVPPSRRATAPARRPARQQRASTAPPLGVVAEPVRPSPAVSPPADSIASRAIRDSLARATAQATARARSDSVAAEREALVRELEGRRARLDSIARRVQALHPDTR